MDDPIGRVMLIEGAQPVRDAVLAAVRARRSLASASADVSPEGEIALALTPIEFRLLAFLMRNGDQALSKDQLLTQVRRHDPYDHNLVEVHISAVCGDLETSAGGGAGLVRTIRRIGYCSSP